jgi:hypothetical protein
MTLREAPSTSGGLTRRSLIKAGLGLTGVAGMMLPSTAAYAAVEAATNLVVTHYRLRPPGWRQGQRLTITAIGPNMGIADDHRACAASTRCQACFDQ